MKGFSYTTYHDMMNWLMGVGTPNVYSNLWVALATTPWDADGTNPGAGEPVGGGYSRVNATGASFWDVAVQEGAAPESSVLKNNSSITFPIATASWGTITDFAIFGNNSPVDGYSGAVLISSGDLTTEKEITIDTIAVFLSEGIQLKLTNTADI